MTDLPPPPSSSSGPGAIPPAPASPASPDHPPWWRRKFAKLPVWAWMIIGIVVFAIAASAGGGEESTDDGSAAPVAGPTDDNAAETSDPSPAPEGDGVESTSPETTSTVAETTTTQPGFESGVLLVGVDIPPGVYAATVPADSFGCYWARLSDLSGDFEAILANDNIASEAQALVEILPTDEAFESNGCGRWVVPELSDPPRTEFGEGSWIVGSQIAPGRYRSSGPGPDDSSCYWARLSGLSGGFEEIIANNLAEGPAVVDIAADDVGFETSGCGSWTLVE